ncbi:MAG: 4Fe-4S binding protein [Candidatus Omnitrophica bacterium]|nr:4Fe-4S binding protein [Candidatus Omnitrophota bacterium]
MFRLDKGKCKGCGACINVCPVQAISLTEGIADIDSNRCIECGRCINVCPVGAISFSSSNSGISSHKAPTPSFIGRGFSRTRGGFGRGGFGRGKRRGRGRGRGFFR